MTGHKNLREALHILEALGLPRAQQNARSSLCLLLMARYLAEIAWESEVWIADTPSHLIHFNGERFLGPYG